MGHNALMGFAEDLARHADQIRARMEHVQGNEEATKQALVVPLLQVLGYDVFDPREVKPEYRADFAVKKAGQFEKVDYAICVNGNVALFVECKPIGAPLEDHGGQLARYFNATPTVRVAMITDGVRLRVFTDLQQPNMMDPSPWLDIDLLTLKPAEIDALKMFRKGDYSADDAVALAEEMVYYNSMVALVGAQFREPSESFVRWVAGEIPAVGRVTAKVVERLTPILRKAMQSVIVEQVTRSFERPPESTATTTPAPEAPVEAPAPDAERPRTSITTPDELEAFRLIETFVREARPTGALGHRDSKSYFTIHQNNLRKWFARIGLEQKPSWIALRHVKQDEARRLAPGVEVGDGGGLGDCRFLIQTVQDISKLRAAVIAAYDYEASRAATADDKGETGAN